jgi:hypothetical protein
MVISPAVKCSSRKVRHFIDQSPFGGNAVFQPERSRSVNACDYLQFIAIRRSRSDVSFQIGGWASKDRRECRIDRFEFACGDRFVGAYLGVHFPCGYAKFAPPVPRGGHRLVFVAERSVLQGTEQYRCLT